MRHFFASVELNDRNVPFRRPLDVSNPTPMKDPITDRIMAMLHGHSEALPKGAPLSPPIVSTAKYKLPGNPDTPYTYGRDINPTIEATEAALSALEAAPVLAFPSGMAAITAALMVAAQPGDRVLVPGDGYYVTRAVLEEVFVPRGVMVTAIPTRAYDAYDLSPFSLVWIETPSNPLLDVCDIATIVARAKASGAKTVVDNTTLTPLLQQPLEAGADMVVSSDTKAISGHGDVLFGHVATRQPELFDALKLWRVHSGSIPGPFEAFLVHRGMMSLEVRLARMCSNAGAVYAALCARDPDPATLLAVRYPGQGFVMGLTFATAGIADRFIAACPSIFPSTSFGGVHTSAERRARWGDPVPEGYVRLSIGCEPEAALRADILEAVTAL